MKISHTFFSDKNEIGLTKTFFNAKTPSLYFLKKRTQSSSFHGKAVFAKRGVGIMSWKISTVIPSFPLTKQ